MHRLLYIILLIATMLGLTATSSCHGDRNGSAPTGVLAVLDTAYRENPYLSHLDSAPQDGLERIRVRNIGRLATVFADNNDEHLEVARKLGIQPLNSMQDIWDITRPLVHIETCENYFIDDLTHSYPYLVPEAASLLDEIGRRFNDSLKSRGGGHYRLKVTSLLRTPGTVKRLRRVNRNSTQQSAHQFGTTFDISYAKFICDDPDNGRTFEDLKNLLAEILWEMRQDSMCLVKYERRQGCFHITARPKSVLHTPGTI